MAYEFQNPSFRVFRRKICRCSCFTIVKYTVAVAVLIHLCAFCRHFSCLISPFQGPIACQNFTLTRPLTKCVRLCQVTCTVTTWQNNFTKNFTTFLQSLASLNLSGQVKQISFATFVNNHGKKARLSQGLLQA